MYPISLQIIKNVIKLKKSNIVDVMKFQRDALSETFLSPRCSMTLLRKHEEP